jgi:hypothetical protein
MITESKIREIVRQEIKKYLKEGVTGLKELILTRKIWIRYME